MGGGVPVKHLNLVDPCRPSWEYGCNGGGRLSRNSMGSGSGAACSHQTGRLQSWYRRQPRRWAVSATEWAKGGANRWGCYHLPFVQLPMPPGKPPNPLCCHAGDSGLWWFFSVRASACEKAASGMGAGTTSQAKLMQHPVVEAPSSPGEPGPSQREGKVRLRASL